MLTNIRGINITRVASPIRAKGNLDEKSFIILYKETTLKVKVTNGVDLFHVLRKSFLNEDNTPSNGRVYLHRSFLDGYQFSTWDIKGPEEYWLKRTWKGELWKIHIVPTVRLDVFTIKEIKHQKIK